MSFDSWIEKTHYSRKKKESLKQLYASTVKCGQPTCLKENVEVKCFLKFEHYPTIKWPRGIYARKDEFKIRVGPIFKCIEEVIFGFDWFIKKVPVCDRPKFLLEHFHIHSGCVDRPNEELERIMVTDYSAYESSFTAEMMNECEFRLYRHMVKYLPERTEFDICLKKVLAGMNYCKFSRLIARFRAKRMSGEMNTSLGNGFTNWMVNMFAVKVFNLKQFKAVFEGDDCLASYIGVKIPESFWFRLGFTVKLLYLNRLNIASFCGQIFDVETLTVVCDPIKVILNLNWVGIKYAHSSEEKLRGLLRTKAFSILYQYPGCPILQSLSLMLMRWTVGVKAVIDSSLGSYQQEIQRLALSSDLPVRPVSFHTRLLMHEICSISPSEQIDLESYFDNNQHYGPIEHPVIYQHCDPLWVETYQKYVTSRFSGFAEVRK